MCGAFLLWCLGKPLAQVSEHGQGEVFDVSVHLLSDPYGAFDCLEHEIHLHLIQGYTREI